MKHVITRPLITEKSLSLAAHGWYSFAADLLATKQSIGRAVQDLYKVSVVSVRTCIMHGKSHRVGRRSQPIRKSNWKKALVRLKEGQTISAFEVTKEGEKK